MKPLLLIALAACGPTPLGPRLDGGLDPDSSSSSDAQSDAGSEPYRHTIAIDGTDDFAAVDRFDTTSSPSFAAMVSWDATNLYIGYSGPDLDPNVGGAGTKWLFVYLDTVAGGATASQQYNTQSAALPFGAEHYLRHKADGTVNSLESYDGVNWATSTSPVTAQGTSFFEMSISRAALGSPTTIRLAAWMINEQNLAEATFAGLYTGNFVDGFNPAVTKYLEVDLDGERVPNDPANAKP